MNEYELIEHALDLLKHWEKDILYQNTIGGELVWRFRIDHNDMVLICFLVLGKKNGVREEMCILRPNEKLLVDKMALNAVTCIGDGYVLPLKYIRNMIKKGSDPALIIEEEMRSVMKHISDRGGFYFSDSVINGALQHSKNSISTVIGGLPSLGRKA